MEPDEAGADSSMGRTNQPLRNDKINAGVDYDEDRVRLGLWDVETFRFFFSTIIIIFSIKASCSSEENFIFNSAQSFLRRFCVCFFTFRSPKNLI